MLPQQGFSLFCSTAGGCKRTLHRISYYAIAVVYFAVRIRAASAVRGDATSYTSDVDTIAPFEAPSQRVSGRLPDKSSALHLKTGWSPSAFNQVE